MERYKRCNVRVNKDFVKRRTQYIYGSVKNYCEHTKNTKMRYWQIVNTPHTKKNVKCLQTLATLLDLSIDEIII